jgi:hypothetical protein
MEFKEKGKGYCKLFFGLFFKNSLELVELSTMLLHFLQVHFNRFDSKVSITVGLVQPANFQSGRPDLHIELFAY